MICRVKIRQTLIGYVNLDVKDENEALATAKYLFDLQGAALPDMDDSVPLEFEVESCRYFYRIWVMPRHGDHYPVYIESNYELTNGEAIAKARTNCFFLTTEDVNDMGNVEEISELDWIRRKSPDEFLDELD